MPTKKQTPTRSKASFAIMVGLLTFLLGWVGIYGFESYNSVRYLFGNAGTPHSFGVFDINSNAGRLYYGERPTDPGYSGAHLLVSQTGGEILRGSFWSESIGWVTLEDVGFQLTDTGSNTWTLSGYGWSPSGGWIDFDGVEYNLTNTVFSGFAWNDGVGWIDMRGIGLEITSSGAIGKVLVLGNLGSSRLYDTSYNIEGRDSGNTTTDAINEIRKNVSILKRNIPVSSMNTSISAGRFTHFGGAIRLDDKVLFENTGSTTARVEYSGSILPIFSNPLLDPPAYSVIITGGDMYIDADVLPENDGRPRAIIALKNEQGIGGNIYIEGGVKQIKSSLIAEGSIYSAEFSGGTLRYYNDDAANLFKIPNRQLYVLGSIISRNTIGGYSIDNQLADICPYNITPCDANTSLLYDFNHFRDFQSGLPEPVKTVLRGYPNSLYDNYSFVIEQDGRILSTPPPGLEQLQ